MRAKTHIESRIRMYEAGARYKAGEPIVLIAADLGLKRTTILDYGDAYFPQFRRPYCKTGAARKKRTPSTKFAQRNQEIREAFESGQSFAVIAAAHGLTREGVRQILTTRFGIDVCEVGSANRTCLIAVNRLASEAQKRGAAEQRFFSVYGCSREFAATTSTLPLSDRQHPVRKFVQQRRSACRRGIEFCLSFCDWWEIWVTSGKWSSRGRGGYVMARYGDTGPYALDNVEIITSAQNASDSYITKSAASRADKLRRTLAAKKNQLDVIHGANHESRHLSGQPE